MSSAIKAVIKMKTIPPTFSVESTCGTLPDWWCVVVVVVVVGTVVCVCVCGGGGGGGGGGVDSKYHKGRKRGSKLYVLPFFG